jgi:aryl-alcohol dehydrogenase-like predicted oxidoreductase
MRTRRDLLRQGMVAGAALFSARVPAVDTWALPLIRRRIPSTGESVSVMGIGTNAFRDPQDPIFGRVLERMHALGSTVIDTAAVYGESEAVIGNALAARDLRPQMFLATKFDSESVVRGGPPVGDAAWGRASFERSLLRLKTDHVDLLQAHRLASVETLMPLMIDLKKQGKARYLGITTVHPEQHPQLIEYMRRYPIDFVQVDYSIDSREAASSVFRVAVERKIAVMAAVPLGGRRGSLLPRTAGHALPSWAADIDVASWSQFLLKYVIADPAVTCAIPGATKLEHLEDDQAAARGRLPDAAMRRKMEEYWEGLRA